MAPESFISARWAGIEGTDLVTTDAAGRFSVPAIAEGTLVLRVLDWPGSSTLLPRIPQGLTVTAGKTTRAEIQLEPSVPVEGLVRTKDRERPVAGVRITLQSFDSDSSIDLTSDANGRCQARVLPGSVWMTSMIPDEIAAQYVQPGFRRLQSSFPFYVSPSSQQVRVKPTPNGQPFQLPITVVIPTKSVKGTVIDPNGRPLANAAVRGDTREGRYWASTDQGGAFDLRVPQWVTVDSYDVALPSRLVTDVTIEKRNPLVLKVKSISAAGGYEFSRKKNPLESQWGYTRATGQIAQSRAEQIAQDRQKPPTGAEKPSTSDAKPSAPPSTKPLRKIAGHVVDRAGKPVAKARLWWVVFDSFPNRSEFTVDGASDSQGRFEMQAPRDWKHSRPLRPANMLWILAPDKDLRAIHAADAAVEEGKASDLTIELAPGTETKYQVNDGQGWPVVGAVVEPRYFRTPRMYEYLPEAICDLLHGTTDKSGCVRLHSLPRKAFWRVQVTAPGFGVQTLRLDGPDAEAAERKVALRAAGRIEGRLIADDPEVVRSVRIFVSTEIFPWKTKPFKRHDGKSVIRAIWETEGTALVVTDEAGRFVVPEIASGPARIQFIDPPEKPTLLPRPPGASVADGQTLKLEIPMERSVLVRGTIRTEDTGQPVAGAKV
ncbi:MAG TPA: carboxypeptidase-like regulatory domain-containing protein, partial [Planctomycetaceae bacterium]|nr:carboxypeptidase-like regulatory domain-containing protein [Planctomycetaceae bacterium]